MIPYGLHSVSEKDANNVIKVLKSNFLTQGPSTEKFQKSLANFCNVKYSAMVSSASTALYVACRALDLQKGDIFWTTPNTYVATANAGLLCGAKIDFVDIDQNTSNICPKSLEEKLVKAKKEKKLPKIVIPIHFAGLPCDQKKIKELSKKYKFKVIEDASHALGSKNENNITGNCKWADITVFSFHPVKIITTGEGGALTTNSRVIYNKIKVLTNNGVTKNFNDYKKKINKKWYYEQHYLSLNFRMSDINAALGLSQVKKIKNFVSKRNMIAKLYNKEFSELGFKKPEISKKKLSSFHLYIIKVEKKIRNKLFDYLIKNKIFINMHYLPVHLHPFYKNKGFKNGDFPNSELHSLTSISLPIYPELSKNKQFRVIKLIKKFFFKL